MTTKTKPDPLEGLKPVTLQFIQPWLDAGYKPCPKSDTWRVCGRNYADALLQKRIVAMGDILYFIEAWVYEPPEYDPSRPPGAEASVQFSHPDGTFNVERLAAKSPAETEEFFARIYLSMGCEPYEKGPR